MGRNKVIVVQNINITVSEWIEKTEAIGLFAKRGKYGGTYAHKDIAFEIAKYQLNILNTAERIKLIKK